MSTRYGDRDYERGERDYRRRSDSNYDRPYGERYRGRSGYGRNQYGRSSDEYGGSQRSGSRYGDSEYGGGSRWRSRGEYRGREGYRPGSENDWDYTDERQSRYGNFVRGYDTGLYDDTSSGSSQRYNYPTGFRSGESYGERSRDYGKERGWLDRLADKLAAWFGDEDAERRQRMYQERQHHGKGPKSYRRSDERIREDVNDRLSEGYLDATEIEVQVADGLVTLTGTVNSRNDRHRAEDIADDVRGVRNIENRLRIEQSNIDRYQHLDRTSTSTAGTGTTETTGTPRTTGTTGTTGTARRRTAGSQS